MPLPPRPHRPVLLCALLACLPRGAWRATALSSAALLAMAAHAQTAVSAAPVALDLPAAPLEQALHALARRTGVQVVFASGVAAGRQAPALRGSFTPGQALDRLLAGSGLAARAADDGQTYVVERAPAAAPASQTATLPEVKVTGSALSDGVTEGTGSYTTDITRTATGLALSPRETPQSVSVVTRQQMDDQAATAVQDALQSTTGLSIEAQDRGRNEVSARGFTVSNFQLDGLPTETGNIGIETTSAAIYDRVEVVRGATGLLNGTGDPSATINLVRKRADSKTFTGAVTAEAGSWHHGAVTADISTPLNASGSVRARLVARGMKEDSFMDLESRKTTTLYGTVEADLTPATRLTVGASQEVGKRRGIYWGSLTFWHADGTRTDWPRSKTTAARWHQWDTDERSAFARLEHTLDNRWKLRADLGHHKKAEESNMMWMSGLPDRVTGLGYVPELYSYYTKPTQSQLALSANGPFRLWGRDHELLLGVIRTEHKSGWYTRDLLGSDIAPVGNFNLWDGSYPQPTFGDLYAGSQVKDVRTNAYVATRLQIADALKLILGAQLTNWTRDVGAAAWTPQSYTAHKRVFTPYVGLVHDLTREVSLYASYTKIFKPQTAQDRNGRYLDPVDGRGMEIGVKGEFLDGRLNASAAVFRIQQDNLAVADEGYFIPGTASQAYRGARGARSQGVELEVAGEVAPGWQLGAGWTQYSARDADGENINPFHPRQHFKLFTKYQFRGDLAGLAVGGGLVWRDTAPYDLTNPVTGLSERVGQPAYALVDLMASYQINRRTSVQLNIKNVFDKKYYDAAWETYTYGAPRSFTVQLKHTF
ncbi:TonB-dependent siderophore receptor [Ottowia sp.]|uniref:TonB-dependent siderophore receptor n=1 Tax=Ottowia sp. TaxID=1898956 RepID=UPI0039E48753